MAKASKKTKASTPSITQIVANIEKDMAAMRTNIKKTIDKEMAQFDKLFKQTKTQFTKAKDKKKKAKDTRVAVAKKTSKKPSAAGKKQLASAKSVYDDMSKMADSLMQDMLTFKDSNKLLKDTHKRFDAMFKAMDKFEKQREKKLNASAKKTKKPSKPRKIKLIKNETFKWLTSKSREPLDCTVGHDRLTINPKGDSVSIKYWKPSPIKGTENSIWKCIDAINISIEEIEDSNDYENLSSTLSEKLKVSGQ